MRMSTFGVMLLLFSITLTSYAAVFTEKTLKQDLTVSNPVFPYATHQNCAPLLVVITLHIELF